MTSDPSVEFSGASHPAPAWPDDAEPLDPNWTPPHDSGFWPPPPPPGGADVDAPQAPRRRHWRLAPHSLTGRLVAGVVTLVVLLVLATGIGTYFALRSFLLNRLDQQVAIAASGDLHRLFETGSVTSAGPGVQAPQTVWAVAIDTSGTVLVAPRGIGVEPMNLSARDRTNLLHRGGGPFTLHTVDGNELRVSTRTTTATALNTGQQFTAIVAIGLSTDELHRTLHRLVVLEWVIGSAAIVLAFAATAYGVRFSLRRLRTVSGTAHEVAAELSPEGAGLDRRVPVEASDTSEVGQLAESMNTLLSAVETQFAARLAHEEQMRQFLADASHELRTPLTSIRGYAELARMQREQGGVDNAENLARIESEGTRMSRLVDDLLTLARTDQGAAPLHEWMDVADLLDEVVSGVRAAFPARRIDVSAPPGFGVVGDRDQLVRVFRNLVTNAAVHTRPDGPISVTATRDGNWATVRIADTGPGLPAEEAAHVFERFWRADKARTRARGGSGLGLAIVASIVQAHGGYVHFESTVERGSVVTVSLPVGTD
jgi:two-component system OmpR family sensor kinase